MSYTADEVKICSSYVSRNKMHADCNVKSNAFAAPFATKLKEIINRWPLSLFFNANKTH